MSEQIPVEITSTRKLIINRATLFNLLKVSGVDDVPDDAKITATGASGITNHDIDFRDDNGQIEIEFNTTAQETVSLTRPRAARKPKETPEGKLDEQ